MASIALEVQTERVASTTLDRVLPAGRHRVDGLYAHVPFCFHKCHYCDFYSFVDADDRQEVFVERMERECEFANARMDGALRSIFVGGGTPTLLRAPLLGRVLRAIGTLPRAADAEWTVEANPETVTQEIAETLVEAGVNRVSVGAQSFESTHLKKLERWHDPASVTRAVEHLRRAGIKNLNLDLIFGIPGQSKDEATRDVQRALEIGIEHLSAYGLTYEPNTAMTKRLMRGDFEPASDDLEAEMYESIRALLASAGFEQYEISNWSKPARACQHNLTYWRNRPWWALGPSASGFVAGHRFKIVPRLGDWLARGGAAPDATGAPPILDHEPPDEGRHVSEALMLGLRIVGGDSSGECAGIDAELEARAVRLRPERAAIVEQAIVHGVLERNLGRLCLSEQGMLVADGLLAELV
ncbi:MAG: radical SAM family heme chaperone HemW [Phycisphaerales bacterium]|nr:radical SAM family heme chaperone HemW [Phycisphaerales bacterium]